MYVFRIKFCSCFYVFIQLKLIFQRFSLNQFEQGFFFFFAQEHVIFFIKDITMKTRVNS